MTRVRRKMIMRYLDQRIEKRIRQMEDPGLDSYTVTYGVEYKDKSRFMPQIEHRIYVKMPWLHACTVFGYYTKESGPVVVEAGMSYTRHNTAWHIFCTMESYTSGGAVGDDTVNELASIADMTIPMERDMLRFIRLCSRHIVHNASGKLLDDGLQHFKDNIFRTVYSDAHLKRVEELQGIAMHSLTTEDIVALYQAEGGKLGEVIDKVIESNNRLSEVAHTTAEYHKQEIEEIIAMMKYMPQKHIFTGNLR